MISGTIKDLLGSQLFCKPLISISGSAGTGKTALALWIVGTSLIENPLYNESCIWVQASEVFPKTRLRAMFRAEPGKLHALNEHIYVIPSQKPCSIYKDQLYILHQLSSEDYITPPNLKFIVIDNISHHLRYKISQLYDIRERARCQNEFYDNYLLPLILFCAREKIHLILIHEATFDVSRGTTRSFFYKLYDRIDALSIILRKEIAHNIIEIALNDKLWAFPYRIVDSGIILMR